jgi:hypothetical protein
MEEFFTLSLFLRLSRILYQEADIGNQPFQNNNRVLIIADQTGRISFQDFRRILPKFHMKIEAKELKQIFADLDTDRNGVLSFEEFVFWVFRSLYDAEYVSLHL